MALCGKVRRFAWIPWQLGVFDQKTTKDCGKVWKMTLELLFRKPRSEEILIEDCVEDQLDVVICNGKWIHDEPGVFFISFTYCYIVGDCPKLRVSPMKSWKCSTDWTSFRFAKH